MSVRKTLRFSIILLTVFILSCTTISINERDAFDAKRTVTIDDFRRNGIAIELITFKSGDTLPLKGWYLSHPQPRGTVLYLGGNGFLLAISQDILTAIYKQKMNVFAFDYRGYGQSSGEPSIAGLKDDAWSAYNYLIETKNTEPERLIIQGHSLGTFLALWLANRMPAAGLILESPLTDAEDMTDRLIPWFLDPFISFEIDPVLRRESNTSAIKNLKNPLLIVSGINDKITPVGMAEKLYETAQVNNKKLVLIENGEHNNLPLTPKYRNAINDFYDEFIGNRPPTVIKSN